MSHIESFFPYESFREGQKEAITKIVDAANNGNKIIEVRAPTGMGKTGCLTTVCKVLQADGYGRAIYTTPQKSLVSQIANDSRLNVVSLLTEIS